MATNPMQRKSRNSFLLGMLLTLVITGLVIALLLMQLKNYREEEATRNANSYEIKVLAQDVESGEVITSDMFKKITIDKTAVPSNAIDESIFLEDEEIVAKVNLYQNTIVTSDMVAKSSEQTTDDLRKQEYNMLILQSQLETGDFIDVRFSLPSGTDFIVLSKKEVLQCNANTIWLKMTNLCTKY